MKTITFYYDVVCPYAYLASTQIEALAARAQATIEWVPILLGGVFTAIGAAQRPAEHMSPPKMHLNALDMKRFAALYNVPLTLHPRHPLRTVEVMRLLHAVDGEARISLTHDLYRAHFGDNRDLSDRAVLADIAGSRANIESIDAQSTKDALRAATNRAVADGVFGVPAFVIEQDSRRVLFWGQDRMLFVEKALGGWRVPA